MTEKITGRVLGRVDGDNLIFQQSWLNQLGLIFLSLFMLGAVFYMNRELPEYTIFRLKTERGAFEIPYLFVLPLVLLAKAAFRVYGERFILAPDYMIDVTGRLSWRVRSVRLEYSRIQEIEIAQTVVQRLLGLGDVIIVPMAGMRETTINMHGVRSPRKVKDILRERQKRTPR